METATAPKCDQCNAVMVRDTRPRTWTYKGRSVTVDQPGWCCPQDVQHPPVLDGPDIAATEAAFLGLRAEVDGLLAPAEVGRIRRRLGLSQRQAGRLLGGGPMALHKYEKDEVAVVRSVAVLLRLLDQHPELLREIPERGDRAA